MQNSIFTLYILELDSLAVKSAKIFIVLCHFNHKIKNIDRVAMVYTLNEESKVSLRSVFIYFAILHVETMFGNKGDGLLHACISSIRICYWILQTINS